MCKTAKPTTLWYCTGQKTFFYLYRIYKSRFYIALPAYPTLNFLRTEV